MKNFIKYISLACASIFALSACNDDEDIIKLDPSTFVAPKVDASAANSVILLEENITDTAMIIKWSAAQYGVNTPPKYDLEIDLEGNNFKNAKTVSSTLSLTTDISVKELNEIATSFGLTPLEGKNLEYRVIATLGTNKAEKLISNVQKINVTVFVPKKDPELFIVGSIQSYYGGNNWSPETGLPMRYIGDGKTKVFEAYIKVKKDDAIKFIGQKTGWDPDNFGTLNGAQNGKLVNSGSSSDVKIAETDGDGFYYIQVDVDKLTYKYIKMNWGIIGDATTNGWNGETPLNYNFENNSFELSTSLNNGELKFRSKNSGTYIYGEEWKFNIGNQAPYFAYDNGAPNFKLTSGKYDIKVKINFDGKVTLEGL